MSKKAARKNRAAPPDVSLQGRAAALPTSKEAGGERNNTKKAGPLPAKDGKAGGDGLKCRLLWLSALVLIVSGYALLHKVDPGGQNAWAIASPALLLCGYLLIIPAIMSTYRED